MKGRTFSDGSRYRYGFNGKEKDNETVGTGEGTQDYGMRIYNPSLGRFLSVDPLTKDYPSWTPYAFAMNRPIDGIDLDGLEYLDAKSDKIDNAVKNPDDTYDVTLGEYKIIGVTLEKIDGKDYYNLKQDMYYGKKGWSDSKFGRSKTKMTQSLTPTIRSFSYDKFVKEVWPSKTNKPMTTEQEIALQHGCVGVTSVFVGVSGIPDLSNSYSTLEKALAQKREMELKNPNSKYVLFSVRFYSASSEQFLPNKDGVVDMSSWDPKSHRVLTEFDEVTNKVTTTHLANFDFGYYEENSGYWWHGNHKHDPKNGYPMTIFKDTLFYYSQPMKDFNRQIFVVVPQLRE